MSKNTRTRILLTAVAALLLLAVTVGGTIAWLTDSTDEVVNTFTESTINIDLDETTGEKYKMVPGSDIAKDPFVTVEEGSETCWIFVKVVEAGTITVGDVTYTFDDYLTYAIDSNWTIVKGSKTDANDTYVIGYNTTIDASADDVTKQILADDKVTVNDTVTKAMMDALNADNYPTLTFTAYAIQSANIEATTVTEAWAVYSAQ